MWDDHDCTTVYIATVPWWARWDRQCGYAGSVDLAPASVCGFKRARTAGDLALIDLDTVGKLSDDIDSPILSAPFSMPLRGFEFMNCGCERRKAERLLQNPKDGWVGALSLEGSIGEACDEDDGDLLVDFL